MGAIGSLFCFYFPEILSKNITSLKRDKFKPVLSCICSLGSIGLIYLFMPDTFDDWIAYSFAFIFYLIAWVDGYSKIIPNRLLVILMLISGLGFWFEPDIQKVLAFGAVVIVTFLIYQIGSRLTSKKMIGWGDMKLTAVLALFLGWEFLLVVCIALILAGLISSIGLVLKFFTNSQRIPLSYFLLFSFLIEIKANFLILFYVSVNLLQSL